MNFSAFPCLCRIEGLIQGLRVDCVGRAKPGSFVGSRRCEVRGDHVAAFIMKVLSLGGSTSSESINRRFARYAASLISEADVTDLDLRTLEVPLYSVDLEERDGAPADAQRFLDMIRSHDAIVISLAEHNGSYTAAFKNLYDWVSRIEQELWSGKPMLLLASSPGGRGGATVLEAAKATFPRMGADLRASFSLPSFYDNFDAKTGIRDAALAQGLRDAVDALTAA